MAVGLVVFTVVGAGYFIHWIIPTMSLAVSFALASVLSPTDAVALSGSVRGVKIPSRLMHLLEGEALLNDASGLVCFRFAVAAALTGTFSTSNALFTFLQVSLGGLAVGALVAFVVMRGERWIGTKIGSFPSGQILLTLLLPFAAYLAAEHLGFSGILSSVAAGFVGNWVLQEIPEAETRIKSEAITDMVQFTFNGFIFILLGLQLPAIGKSISLIVKQEQFRSAWVVGIFVLSITLCLALLRFLWTWTSLKWTFYREKRNTGTRRPTPKRLLVAMSLAGVRGAVTLAAVLSLPLTLNDGTALPGRDLAILLSAGVILFSLVTASVGLPVVMKGVEEPPESSREAQERKARVLSAQAAIKRLEEVQHQVSRGSDVADGVAAIASRLMAYYRRRMEALTGDNPNQAKAGALRAAEIELRLEAVRAERHEINRLIEERELDQEAARAMLHKLDNTEAALQGN